MHRNDSESRGWLMVRIPPPGPSIRGGGGRDALQLLFSGCPGVGEFNRWIAYG